MKYSYMKFMLIVVIIVVSIATILITDKNAKLAAEQRIKILSTLDNQRSEELLKTLSEKFPKYTFIIKKVTNHKAEKYILEGKDNIGYDFVIGVEESRVEDSAQYFESYNYESLNMLDAYKRKNKYAILAKNSSTFVVNKKLVENIPTNIEDLLKSEYKGKVAMTDYRYNATSYAFLDYVYTKEGEKKGEKYMEKLYSLTPTFASTNDDVVNLMNKNLRTIALLPEHMATKMIRENPDYKMLNIMQQKPYTLETIFMPININILPEEQEVLKEMYNYILKDFITKDRELYMKEKVSNDMQEYEIENLPMQNMYNKKLKINRLRNLTK